MNARWLLIVDDEKPILRLIKRILSAEGFNCRTAADASEAQKLLHQQPFDLILTDIKMPGESGLDLVRRAKKISPNTGVVIISVISDPDVAREAMEAGIYGYIVKPFEKSQVIITIRNALRLAELEAREKNRQADLERLVNKRTAELLDTQDHLRRIHKELKSKEHTLQRTENALQAIMDYRQHDQRKSAEAILLNVKQAVQPYLDRLRQSRLTDRQTQYLDILETGIQEIVSPFIQELSSIYFDLSPTELQVAHLIREGRSTKEISDILNLSINTVMTHRYKIRTKLGLTHQNKNLHVFLRSLVDQ